MEQTYDPVLDNLDANKKREYWDTSFGLQAVDGLKPSEYMQSLADDHVAGRKSYYEVNEELNHYYSENSSERIKNSDFEADEVSKAIYAILSDEAFRFDVPTFKSYHRRLFQGLHNDDLFHPGEFRTVNITKKEYILNGDTVQYQDYSMLEETMQYDFSEEEKQNYIDMTDDEKVSRLSEFTSHIWQVHPFREGNTRTVAVFIEKYLKSLGYKVDNEQFKLHSSYFRGALVRANYSNIPNKIERTSKYLEMFFENLLLHAGHELKIDDLKI